MMADAQNVLPRSVDIFDDIRALKREQEALRRNLAELESRLEKELQREDQKIKGDIEEKGVVLPTHGYDCDTSWSARIKSSSG